jgi:subtilisin family serine protease
MNWTRNARRPDRRGCRPRLETLEVRNLLSTSPGHVIPAAGSPSLPANDPNAQFDTLIGASATRSQYHVDGTGLTAAVIDTGIDYNNPDLGSGFGAGLKVEAGYNFADGNPDPNATASQHGTAVAGLIASTDATNPGVAPKADLVALRVIGQTGNGDFDTVGNALQWVIDNHQKYNISVVNLSIADGSNYSMDWFSNDGWVGQRLAGLIQQLNTLNIPVVTAAGNDFTGQQGMAFPAILPETLSVTATDASDHLVSDAQRLGTAIGGASATKLAAPGAGLTAPEGDTSSTTVDGTSFAAPLVSGSILLLQQIYQQRFGQLPSVSQLENWLQNGSDHINDSVTGITLDRLDVLKSAALIPANGPGGGPSGSPGGSQGSSDGGSTSQNNGSPATNLYLNGQSQGQVSSSGASNPLSDFFSQFGITGTFNSVQGWTSSNIPKTQLFLNGQPAGSVPSDSPSNPLSGYANAFGQPGTFQTVQGWTSSTSQGAPAGTLSSGTSAKPVVGTSHPAGSLLHIVKHVVHPKARPPHQAVSRFTHGR